MGTAVPYEDYSDRIGARLGWRPLQLCHHAMACQRKHLACVRVATIALRPVLIGTELRSGAADCGRNRVQGMTRSLTHELEAAADLELGQQGRNVEFDGAFGEIQLVGNFLVGKTAKNAIEDFLFAAGEAHGVLGAMTRFGKLLSL